MARIKIRIALNKGRHGAPLAKLGRISEQAEKFLRSLAADCNVETKPDEWLAVNFRNGSVQYDAEFQGDVDSGAAEIFAKNLSFLADFDIETEGLNGAVSEHTAVEYARIGTLIDPDETVGIGIFVPGISKPRWRQVAYSTMATLRRELETPLPSYGSLQGILNTWFKEAREPYFSLRELATESVVKVFYPAALYGDVARAVQERTTVLMVAGNMLYDRVSKTPAELKAERIDRMQMLSGAEFEHFFGSAPDYEHHYEDA